MARPRLQIDSTQVEKLASLGCTNVEIADIMGCDEGTIRNRFSDILTKGRANLKARLRMRQLRAADAGNVVMLIWLGKQMLGQIDRLETDNTNRDIQVTFDDLPEPRAKS